MLKPNEFSLSTEDKELFNELVSLRLDGVKVYPEIRKALDPETVWNVIVALSDNSAVNLLAGWLLTKLSQSKTKKTTINSHPIPQEKSDIIILIKNELKIDAPTSKKKKKKP
jgi:hypothetical protein